MPLKITATDRTRSLLERAAEGIYPESSVRDLPPEFFEPAFIRTNDDFEIKSRFKTDIGFLQQDIRFQTPAGRFDLILCRNLVFTYFDEDLQRSIAEKIVEKLAPGGFFIAGSRESVPAEQASLVLFRQENINRKIE